MPIGIASRFFASSLGDSWSAGNETAVYVKKWYDFLKSGTTFFCISCSRKREQLSRHWE
jgi:hypothetical protein